MLEAILSDSVNSVGWEAFVKSVGLDEMVKGVGLSEVVKGAGPENGEGSCRSIGPRKRQRYWSG